MSAYLYALFMIDVVSTWQSSVFTSLKVPVLFREFFYR